MKKQSLKVLCLLLFLILFVQCNSLSAQTPEESLYKRLGGVYNIAAVIDDFVDRLLFDSVIVENKSVVAAMGKITKPGLKYQLTELLCQTTGGPQKYNGRSMKESHQGLNISEAQWQAMVKDFLATLEKSNIKQSEQNELLVIVGSTKNDIVASALPVNPAPQPLPNPNNLPQPALPSTPPQATTPAIPEIPNPINIMPQIPGLPEVPPAQPINPPAIPEIPNPANVIPQIPGFPEIPPAQPSNPPADSVPQGNAPEPANIPSDLPPEPVLEPAE